MAPPLSVSRLLAAILVAVSCAIAAAAHADPVKVTFLLTSDLYEIEPDAAERGGLARLAGVVKAERAVNPNVVLVHAGDAISPSLLSSIDQGAHMMALLSDIGFDVFVPGNHEFDFGPDVFLKRLAEARFPVIASNLRDGAGQPVPGTLQDRLIEIAGVKIGIAGFITETTPITSSPGPMQFTPVLDGALDAEARLRKAGADLVVQVVHTPRDLDLKLIDERAGDLILSGHDHDLFVAFNGMTAFAESMHDAWYVVAVDLTITIAEEDGKRTVSWWPDFRVIDTASVVPDPAMAARVVAVQGQLDSEIDTPIATLTAPLDLRERLLRGAEAAVGNLFADALRQGLRADVAILDGGGIRGDKVLPAGRAITRRDVMSALPFNNTAVMLELDGKSLRAALENGFAKAEGLTAAFPQVSGLVIKADLTRPAGERIVSIAVNGAPLDDSRLYTVATSDYIARGGDGYTAFKDARRLVDPDDGKLLTGIVIAYLEGLGTVDAKVDGRVVVARSTPLP